MTNAEVFDLMMARLAGRTSPTTRGLLVKELNLKIDQLESAPSKPWFLEATLSDVLTASQNFYELPADFIEEFEDGALRLQNMDGTWSDPDPRKVNMEVLERETDGLDPALPEGYALYGNALYFGPTPDQAYPFKLKYYQSTGEIADDAAEISNPWLVYFFNFVTLATMYQFALLHLQGTELAIKIKPEYELAADMFKRAVESRKHVNMDYLLGDTEN